MKLEFMKAQISSGSYDNKFHLLYDDIGDAKSRYLSACDEFEANFGQDRDVELFSAPGRTEVGGNHTDHQRGCVLTGSVNLDIIAVASRNNDNCIRVKSAGFEQDTVELCGLTPCQNESECSASLIRGVCAGMVERGYKIGGFDAFTTSNVLKGSGLSSSAAFEVLICTIISHLFNDGELDSVTIAQISQYAENEFFGKPCGLMDQMASSVGGFTSIDFHDIENPIVQKVDFDFDLSQHSLCIVNTGGNHADLTSEYAAITDELAQVSNYFGKTVLRDVDENEFRQNIAQLRSLFGERAVLRAMHFYDENRRAICEAEALKNNEFDKFLALVNESGRSSFMKLQNVFTTFNVQEQGLSLALAVSEHILGNRGACRVHGGGFGGTIQAFVPNDLLSEYKEAIESVFGQGSCYVLKIRCVGGTKI